jgi:hypothetical protein
LTAACADLVLFPAEAAEVVSRLKAYVAFTGDCAIRVGDSANRSTSLRPYTFRTLTRAGLNVKCKIDKLDADRCAEVAE